jgi:hypothetical protein
LEAILFLGYSALEANLLLKLGRGHDTTLNSLVRLVHVVTGSAVHILRATTSPFKRFVRCGSCAPLLLVIAELLYEL